MGNKQEYEITGGIVETPEMGNIVVPPEKCGRKDIIAGELTISKASVTPENLAKRSRNAKKNGITEIPPQVTEKNDEGR